ncbi:Polar-differentiation response regulator DivK [compost metagenome]
MACAASVRPDVVLLDLGMPTMDGFETARRLREIPELRHARIVALTGFGQPDDRRRTRAAGFDLHLVKPADLGALTRMLDELDA